MRSRQACDLMLGWNTDINVTTDVKRWILEDAGPRSPAFRRAAV
jgi:hypothetical protein